MAGEPVILAVGAIAMDNRRVPVDHYENFPVASLLCPPRLRPAVEAIYHFARIADDIADEGDAAPAERLASLAAYGDDLAAVASGHPPSNRWRHAFNPLAAAIERHRLPVDLLAALLDAFTQDVTTTRYADRAALLDYCRRSANPVGRLLLHLYGIDAAEALARSDAICSALQLANFWQDLGRDTSRGRLYVPEAECRRHGIDPADLIAGRDSTLAHSLVAELTGWARELMGIGAPLVHAIPGRAGWELRLVVQGGLRVLDRIDRMDGATLLRRPQLGWADAAPIVWRAVRMRPLVGGAGHSQRVA
ncbi:MAG: squalene synthase HpnC [Pseudomonadota bacterium]|nr:squalene synthase HpnC [Pseudomonadota bacterium]